ncbi:MAG: hypothetical protein JZU52_03325 [Lamprocystis purpurea]|jgi:hypothetical protein|uniref:hypothetical protein n=1 Tax=Lamprocystis purpurea TaxID=61598 RepID=UPI0012F722BE|nr:hypothetical protein [Lamprocystis purpurea]MBV5272699.1 hypothetical protein [Lamprocystis purpurea]
MDALVTLLRLPFGLIATVVVIVFWLAIFPFETIAMIVAFPFAAIFMSRSELGYSWIGKYPNSLKAIPEKLEAVWEWVGGE